MTTAPEKSAPLFNSTRSAVIVHLLSWATLGVLLLVAYFLNSSEERSAAMGVAIPALAVLIFWSVVLAIRAIENRERLNTPLILLFITIAVVSVTLTHAFLFGIGYVSFGWAWPLEALRVIFGTGLPLLLPLLLVYLFVRVPFAIHRRRHPESKPAKALWIFSGVVLATALWLAPFVLFAYCALPLKIWDPYGTAEWRASIADSMPNFIRDRVYDNFEVKLVNNEFRFDLVVKGRVSPEKLCKLIENEHVDILAWGGIHERELRCMTALESLERYHPNVALDSSLRVLNGQQFAPQTVQWQMALLVVRKGSSEQILKILESRKPAAPEARFHMIRALGNTSRAEFASRFVSRIIEIVNEDSEDSLVAMDTLTSIAPPAQIQKLFEAFVLRPRSIRLQKAALSCIEKLPSFNSRAFLISRCLEASDLSLKREILRYRQMLVYFGPDDDGYSAPLIGHLEKLLYDPDVVVRNGAFFCLYAVFGKAYGDASIHGRELNVRKDAPTEWNEKPETDAERAAIDRMKKFAKEWLSDFDKAAK